MLLRSRDAHPQPTERSSSSSPARRRRVAGGARRPPASPPGGTLRRRPVRRSPRSTTTGPGARASPSAARPLRPARSSRPATCRRAGVDLPTCAHAPRDAGRQAVGSTIRVAVNREPRHRAVIDLVYAAAHRVEAEDGVVIVFRRTAGGSGGSGRRGPRPRVPRDRRRSQGPNHGPKSRVPWPLSRRLADAGGGVGAARSQGRARAEGRAPNPALRWRPGKRSNRRRSPRRSPGEKAYTGHLITFDFYQADLAHRAHLPEISGLNSSSTSVPTGTVDGSPEVPGPGLEASCVAPARYAENRTRATRAEGRPRRKPSARSWSRRRRLAAR
jgi:hypothetical protein